VDRIIDELIVKIGMSKKSPGVIFRESRGSIAPLLQKPREVFPYATSQLKKLSSLSAATKQQYVLKLLLCHLAAELHVGVPRFEMQSETAQWVTWAEQICLQISVLPKQ
jgi:hypothetical protein